MDIKPLINLLIDAGWKLSSQNTEVFVFIKQFPHIRFKSLTYSVRIVTSVASATETRSFKLCRLTGPTLNARTGAFIPHDILGEWYSLNGAIAGVIPKFNTVRKDYQDKETKVTAKKFYNRCPVFQEVNF